MKFMKSALVIIAMVIFASTVLVSGGMTVKAEPRTRTSITVRADNSGEERREPRRHRHQKRQHRHRHGHQHGHQQGPPPGHQQGPPPGHQQNR